jgi:hypothetical protein
VTSLARRTRREVKRWASPANVSSVRLAAVAVTLAALVDERKDADAARLLRLTLWHLRDCAADDSDALDQIRARVAEKRLGVLWS